MSLFETELLEEIRTIKKIMRVDTIMKLYENLYVVNEIDEDEFASLLKEIKDKM